MAALDYVFFCHGTKRPQLPKGITLHDAVLLDAQRKAAAVEAGKDYSLSEFDQAEIILTAGDSLWYVQARDWAEGKTPVGPGDSPEAVKLFQQAGETICEIVKLGCVNGRWWNTAKLWPDPKERAARLFQVLLVVFLLGKAIARGANPGVSAALQFLPRLMIPRLDIDKAMALLEKKGGAQLVQFEIRALFDKPWAQELAAAKRKAREGVTDDGK
jgi:hypothetical protein